VLSGYFTLHNASIIFAYKVWYINAATSEDVRAAGKADRYLTN